MKRRDEEIEIWFDDTQWATEEEIKKLPPLPPEKQRELEAELEEIIQRYLERDHDVQ